MYFRKRIDTLYRCKIKGKISIFTSFRESEIFSLLKFKVSEEDFYMRYQLKPWSLNDILQKNTHQYLKWYWFYS